jgi:hypothetical protein
VVHALPHGRGKSYITVSGSLKSKVTTRQITSHLNQTFENERYQCKLFHLNSLPSIPLLDYKSRFSSIPSMSRLTNNPVSEIDPQSQTSLHFTSPTIPPNQKNHHHAFLRHPHHFRSRRQRFGTASPQRSRNSRKPRGCRPRC